jgi:[protein-PII] uridylyltransferase
MSSTSGLRASVIAAKQRWDDGRAQARQLHDQGAPGRRVTSALSDLLDEVLFSLWHAILESVDAATAEVGTQVCLVLHGGCGRRSIAPFSDVDLMLLHSGDAIDKVQILAQRISQDIVDMRLQLGFSVRTPRDACSLATKDPQIFSSLTEARYLSGNVELYDAFYSRLKRIALKRWSSMIRGLIQAREKERQRYGETVYLLRPNVKKSRGALRDIHLVRWIGFVRFGVTDIDRLARLKAISDIDAERLRAAGEFLLRLRNDMHFHANRANDDLVRNEQIRIAEKFGYPGDEATLPAEQMMRDYFQHTSRVQYASDHFLEMSQLRPSLASFLTPLVTRQIDEYFHIGPYYIGANKNAVETVSNNVELVLRLMQLANLHSKEIEHETWEAIRNSMVAEEIKLTKKSAELFVELLSSPNKLGSLLRRLHELKVLEKIIPAFEHARGLLQFNEYHQYTVDEHSIQTVERAAEFEKHTGTLGEAYRSIRDKKVLHLALLLHDLGKGYTEDHSEVGLRLADEIVRELGLETEEGDVVKFLVHQHLMMAHLAMRRDLNDEALVARFAASVGSLDVLKKLYVLTCADMAAVGPDVLNQWRAGLITELYKRARNVLTGHHAWGIDQATEQMYEDIARQAPDMEAGEWLRETAKGLPNNYCRDHTPTVVAEQLLTLKEMMTGQIKCWVFYSTKRKMVEVCIGKSEHRRSGVFCNVSGMLAGKGLKIKSADIKPLGESMIWYWFQCEDMDFEGKPPKQRLQDIRELTLATANSKEIISPTFSKRRKKGASSKTDAARIEFRVEIDNQTVASATIIDVFARYKLGSLHAIAKRIYELGLDVHFARITTYGEQVVHVFYLTDKNGNKIRDPHKLAEIQKQVLDVASQFLEANDTITTTRA